MTDEFDAMFDEMVNAETNDEITDVAGAMLPPEAPDQPEFDTYVEMIEAWVQDLREAAANGHIRDVPVGVIPPGTKGDVQKIDHHGVYTVWGVWDNRQWNLWVEVNP